MGQYYGTGGKIQNYLLKNCVTQNKPTRLIVNLYLNLYPQYDLSFQERKRVQASGCYYDW